MKNTILGGVNTPVRTKIHFKLSFILLLTLGLSSCYFADVDNSEFIAQKQLLQELENNQLLWSESGVNEYSFSLETECDCPDDLKSQKLIATDVDAEEDSEEMQTEMDALSKTGKVRSRKVTARDDDKSSRRSNSTQGVRMETVFSDLRQAILQNNVQSVAYNPTYGYPQTVSLNSAFSQPINFNQRSLRNSDDDDDNRNIPSNLSIQARNFQVLGTNTNPQILSLNGQLIRQSNSTANGVNPYWLVDDDGRWNQLNVPTNIRSTINNLPNQSYVQVNGQRLPGGINGQGLINLQQISPNQAYANQNNLNGTLYYSVTDNDSYDLDDFYVNSDRGRNVFLNVPTDLRNQALRLAGQRVNLSGNWSSNFSDPNARFSPNGFNSINATLQRFSGILTPGSAYPIPGVQQSNYMLVDDYGSILELQIPGNILNSIGYAVGQRVEVLGTRLNAGNFGQPVIYVQSVNQIQNVFTNTQISGVISAVYPTGGYNYTQRVAVQLDSGRSVTVQIPSNFSSPYNQLTAGMRIQVTGAWLSSAAGFGQGEFEARAPVQITNLGINTNTTYTGYISNIGSTGGINCNVQQSNYGFTTDNGQTFQLYISSSTQITGVNNQGTSLPYQARVQVSGITVSPGVLQAQTINVFPQSETTIAGTIIEVGPVGGTFTCTGGLYTYRLLDNYGNAYSITTTPNSIVQGSLGSFLRVGDYVQARGTMTNNGTTFYARQVTAVPGAGLGGIGLGGIGSGTGAFPQGPGFPTFPGTTTGFPTFPGTNATATFVGTVTGQCSWGNATDSFTFVDQNSTMYTLNVNMSQAGYTPGINVGSQLQVTGSVSGNVINAQQLTQLQTFADPLNRIPVSGTIMSTIPTSVTSSCASVNTYQFQTDNGQIQQLRMSSNALQGIQQPLTNGMRVTVTARIQSVNPQLIDALEVQYAGSQSFGVGSQPYFGAGGLPPYLTGQTVSVLGTITATSCANEVYFVDQNGTGYLLQLNSAPSTVYAGVGTRLNVTGQFIGNKLVATTAYSDQSQAFFPSQALTRGTLSTLMNQETLSCGTTITTYTFLNDNGRSQRIRITSNGSNFSGQTPTVGSRIQVTNKIESFDGSVIDALSISQQGFF